MKETFRKNIANYITCIRILCVIAIIFTKTFSMPFFILYFVSGASDCIDGYLARKLKIQSEFGARLDSFADLLFLGVCMIKVLPAIAADITIGLWISLAVIVVIKKISIFIIVKKTKSFGLLHTLLAKFNGFLLFFAPFFIPLLGVKLIGIILAAFCGVAGIEELIYVAREDEINFDTKGILFEKIK